MGSAKLGRAGLALAALLLAPLLPRVAAAQEGQFFQLTLTPESDGAASGTCNEFTARVTRGESVTPVDNVIVDVAQTLQNAGDEPGEGRELSFCTPQQPQGANPVTGPTSANQGPFFGEPTRFGDVSGNNPGATSGQPGRNTTVHAEVGPTDSNGEVTFGISMAPSTSSGVVTVTSWVDPAGDDDVLDEGDPFDVSTKTWTGVEQSVTTLDAAPESATNPNGAQHTVTVTVSGDGGPVSGVVPLSLIEPDGAGRPAGDAANPAAGPSPNFTSGKGKPGVYACSASNAQGMSTCTFQDPLASPPGTDTVVFFVDLVAPDDEADPGDPQDGVQTTWTAPQGGGGGGTPSTPEPRNVRLCHGPSPSPACETAPQSLEAGDSHTLSVLVTDRQGAPLAGVPVELRHVGPADFESTGTDSVRLTTGADGTARAVLASDVEGTSQITAEIDPQGSAGSSRGPGAADDECEQPAGPGGAPPAGNCVSQTLTVMWELVPVKECLDGLDNDEDGLVDFGEDPGCIDELDDEEPFNGVVGDQPHERRLNMRFRDWVGPGDEGLVIFGRLRLADEDDDFRDCTQGRPVDVQRLVDGEWKTRKQTTTNMRGRYAGVVFDVPGPYRAVAPVVFVTDEAGRSHRCLKVLISKTHHHRR